MVCKCDAIHARWQKGQGTLLLVPDGTSASRQFQTHLPQSSNRVISKDDAA